MNTRAMINFLRGIENPAPLDLTGDPDHDRQILAAAADSRLQAYEAAFGRPEPYRSRTTKDQFEDPPLHRDFYRLDNGTILELVRDPDREGRIRFVKWKPGQQSSPPLPGDEPAAPDPQTKSEPESKPAQITYIDHLPIISGPDGSEDAFTLLPPDPAGTLGSGSLLNAVRLPATAEPYDSLADLITAISLLILRCVAISETDARLLAHFVLATWLIDRLPIAPYVAIVGPQQSGKTTLLRVLHLLCRRSLFASDATALSLLHACNELHPTLLIDETSSIDDPAALRRLLRIGNTPGSLVLRYKHAWNVFGAKVICWRELPDDPALNSRCIILGMQATNDPALRLPSDPDILDTAAALQSQLLYYRLANYDQVAATNNEATKSLPPRARELCRALLAPCANDEQSCNFLLDYFRNCHPEDNDSLSPAEQATLVALFHLAHLPEHRNQMLTKEVTARANRYLHDEREHFELPIRRAGAILTGFTFAQRRRTKRGWALMLQREDQRRLHNIAERYGIDLLRDDMPGFTACHFCPEVRPTDRPFAVGVVTG